MKSITIALLIVISNYCFATNIKEGMCLKSPNLPKVVMQVSRVGDTTLSFKTNLSGDLLNQYSKSQLEEELRVGTTVEVPCSEYKAIAESANESISELFGYSLEDSYTDFQKKMTKNIKACRDEKYKTSLWYL